MAEPEEIFRRCRELLGETDSLAGRRVLVSAGGTREPLDAVRFLGNRSSGRMGVALAEEARQARRRGDPCSPRTCGVPAPPGIEVVETPTAAGDARAGARPQRRRSRADGSRRRRLPAGRASPARSARRTTRRGRSRSSRPPTCSRTLGEQRTNGQVLIGFAAEPGRAGSRARAREAGSEARRPRRLQRRVARATSASTPRTTRSS